MIVNEDWKPRPRKQYLCYYHGIQSTYYEHLQWITYVEWRKEIGAIKDFEYIFFQPKHKYLVKYNNRNYYFLPFLKIIHVNDVVEYQAYSNPNKWYQKMWLRLQKQRPLIASTTRILGTHEIRHILFDLWTDTERDKRFKQIKFLGDVYNG